MTEITKRVGLLACFARPEVHFGARIISLTVTHTVYMAEELEKTGIRFFEVVARNPAGALTEWGKPLLTHGHHAQLRTSAFDGEEVYFGA